MPRLPYQEGILSTLACDAGLVHLKKLPDVTFHLTLALHPAKGALRDPKGIRLPSERQDLTENPA